MRADPDGFRVAFALFAACVAVACSPSKSSEGPPDGRAGGDASGEASTLHFGVTPGSAEALSGLCALALLDVDAGACTGIDAFLACASSACGIDTCVAGGCTDFNDCLVNSADPCNSGCTPPVECTCLAGIQSCALTKCIGVLTCGSYEAGTCAALDRCCDLQPTDAGMTICRQLANVSKVRGDMGCQQAFDITFDAGMSTMLPFTSCADLVDP